MSLFLGAHRVRYLLLAARRRYRASRPYGPGRNLDDALSGGGALAADVRATGCVHGSIGNTAVRAIHALAKLGRHDSDKQASEPRRGHVAGRTSALRYIRCRP